MTTWVRVLAASACCVATVTACKDPLTADNLQNPDIVRVYSQPSSIEAAIGSGYQQCRNQALNTNAFQQMQAMSFEIFSGLNNYNMGPVSAIPRPPLINTKATQTLASGTWNNFANYSRNAANAIAALDRLTKAGGTIGTPGQDARARAFGFFDVACNLGYLALTFDSAAIVNHIMPSDSVPPLSGYQDVAAAALANLDSAIAMANLPAASGSGGFPTLPAWMSGTTLSKADFVRLMRSWKARIRADVARSKAERDAVDWAAVIADATNGISADVTVNVGGSTGWSFGWQGSQAYVDAGWHQLTMMILGGADNTGQWDGWLATPKDNRPLFLLQTSDLRWPAGATRKEQQDASVAPGSYLSRPYIRNNVQDSPGQNWGQSYYSWQRFQYYQAAGNTGSVPEFMKAEVDMLAAEGYIRTGNANAAAALIDNTRVARGGLPALSGVVTSTTQLIPGPNCVPRVPVGPSFSSTQCANLMEAMKYEKRMETGMQWLGAWFFDSRGWQNLYEATPLMYPVSVSELDARYGATAEAHYYNVGGGGIYSSPASLYGFEIR